MSDGRRSQVVLLDERRFELVIQPKLYACELLDLVASHFNLKEKEYFGISYHNEAGQISWLQLDKRVLEHEFPKKSSPLILYFRVKYYVESISQLRDAATVEAFYLQAKSLLAKGELKADGDTVFQLAALVLQATNGDYLDDSIFKSQLKKIPVLPASTLKEQTSIAVCEEKVLQHYKALAGHSRGAAIVNYLSIVERLPTYGQHYYEIKDKSGASCWLGLSYRGISQYDKADKCTPKKVFLWKQLENLYYRDRKFTIEVHEARRVIHALSSFNLYEDAIEEPVEEFDDLSNAICDPTTQVSVSRRTLAPANVTVYVWYAPSPFVAKCIWSMAIAQHHFFLDRKHHKSKASIAPNLSQIASELCRSVQSLSSASSQSNISRSNSSSSLPASFLAGEISEESKAATIEMLTALQARKEALEDALKKKTEELKSLCLKEGELTGEVPPETPFLPGEAQPQVRRRIGTSFTLSDKIFSQIKNKERETLSELELDYEIQSKIASAAFKLANDTATRKTVRKQRQLSYYQAATKLRDIEQKLYAIRKQKDRNKSVGENGALEDCDINLSRSVPDSLILADDGEGSEEIDGSPNSSSVPPSNSLPQLMVTDCDITPSSSHDVSTGRQRQRHRSLQHVPQPAVQKNSTLDIHNEVSSWKTAPAYSVGSEFDDISCGSESVVSLKFPYRNRFESSLDIEGTNLYSVPNRRASQVFDSQDDLIVGGRKSDIRQSSASVILKNNSSKQETVPLSASYDECLWYGKSKDQANDRSSLETSFEDNSIHSADSSSIFCFETENSKPPDDFGKNQSKLTHFYSENSLHRDESENANYKLDSMRISEPDLNLSDGRNTVPRVSSHSNDTRIKASYGQLQKADTCSGVNSQSINQVAELVQASMLLQDSKRINSENASYSNPKVKTKEWVETSLDSPILVRKQKHRHGSVSTAQKAEPQEPPSYNIYENIPSKYNSPSVNQQYKQQLTLSSNQNTENCHSSSNISCNSAANSQVLNRLQYHTEDELSNKQNAVPFSSYTFTPIERNSASQDLYISPGTSYAYGTPAPVSDSCHQYFGDEYYHNTDRSFVNSTSLSHSTEPCDITSSSRLCLVSGGLYSENGVNSHEPQITNFYSSPETSYEIEAPPSSGIQYYEYSQPDMYTDGIYESSSVHNQFYSEPVMQSRAALVESPASIHQYPSQSSDNVAGGMCFPAEQCLALPSVTNSHPDAPVSACSPINFPYAGNVEVNVVSVGHFQPYWEETKPYELSDFYKYSTKHRKSHQKSFHEDTVKKSTQNSNVIGESNGSWMSPSQVPEHFGNISEVSGRRSVSDAHSHQDPHCELSTNTVSCEHPNTEKEFNSICESDERTRVLNVSHSSDENNSFGEIGLKSSLADAFHEEMLAWYEGRDRVKKATLV